MKKEISALTKLIVYKKTIHLFQCSLMSRYFYQLFLNILENAYLSQVVTSNSPGSAESIIPNFLFSLLGMTVQQLKIPSSKSILILKSFHKTVITQFLISQY